MQSDTEKADPTPESTRESWWNNFWMSVRRVGVFLLGVTIIVHALVYSNDPWPELIIGGVMVGVFPLEDLPLKRRN
jgi:hypothetical protein